MKKFLLFLIVISCHIVSAQCPVTITGNTVVCSGGCVTLQANGATSYTWGPTSGSVNSTTVSACPTSGNNFFMVTGGTGTCVATASVSIFVDSISVTVNTAAVSCVQSSGSATATPGGGMSPYTYTWAPGGGTTSGNTYSNLSPGSYTVVAGDANGCSSAQAFSVGTSTSIPTISFSTMSAFCGQSNGSASVIVNGGSGGPYSYQWNPGGVTTQTVNALSPFSIYSVVVTDLSSGCTASDTVSVGIVSNPTVTANANDVSCYGACNGSGTLTVTGGIAPYTYSWMPGNMTAQYLPGLCPGTYTVIIHDNLGCPDSVTVTISQPAPIIVSTSANPPTICAGGTTTLTATANGGTPAYTYNWTPGNVVMPTYITNPSTLTIFTITATDANACTGTSLLTVNVLPSPSVTFTLAPNAAPHVWDIYPSYSGGSGSYSYSWDWGDGSAADTVAYPSHTYAIPGWYNICATITDSLGCSASVCQSDSVYRNASGVMVSVTVINGVMGIVANNSGKINLYPNPANESIVIETATACSVELYDLEGKLRLSKELTGKTKLDVSEYQEGMYTLRIKTSSQVVNKKFVIAH